MTQTKRSINRVAWILGGVVLVSFAFGVLMFLPAEHRAKKIQETVKKYQAKQERRAHSWSISPSR